MKAGPIYLPISQLRAPTQDEMKDAHTAWFFDPQSDVASSYVPSEADVASPVRTVSSGYARDVDDLGSFYNPESPLRSDVFDQYDEEWD